MYVFETDERKSQANMGSNSSRPRNSGMIRMLSKFRQKLQMNPGYSLSAVLKASTGQQ